MKINIMYLMRRYVIKKHSIARIVPVIAHR